jgi:hypothetical protein
MRGVVEVDVWCKKGKKDHKTHTHTHTEESQQQRDRYTVDHCNRQQLQGVRMSKGGKGGSNNEVPALIEAVKEHQKFRQLACYSIECLSKVNDCIFAV